MTASRTARQRRAATEAGALAGVRVDVDGRGGLVYKLTCTECVVEGRGKWGTYRPGTDNGFVAAMDRWTFHLVQRHAGVSEAQAPCLAYLPAAQQRLHERRESQA